MSQINSCIFFHSGKLEKENANSKEDGLDRNMQEPIPRQKGVKHVLNPGSELLFGGSSDKYTRYIYLVQINTH